MLHSLLSSLPDLHDKNPSTELPSATVSSIESVPGKDVVSKHTEPADPAASDTGQPDGATANATALDRNHAQDDEVVLRQEATPESLTQQGSDDPTVSSSNSTPEASTATPASDDLEEKVPFLLAQPEDATEESTIALSLVAELNNVPIYLPPPSSTRSRSPSPPPQAQPRLYLPTILAQADALAHEFPPDRDELCLREIFGPASVLLTWSEDPARIPAPDEAEALLERPGDIVRPYVEETPGDESDKEDKEWVEEEENRQRARRRRNRLRKRRKVERGVVLATAVLVLGVALAMYAGQGPREREWRRAGGWVVGVIGAVGKGVWEGVRNM
jgi:hypothetical protein